MKKTYIKPEIELVDLTAKESLMVTGNGYDYPTIPNVPDDFWMDATSKKGYEEDDYIW